MVAASVSNRVVTNAFSRSALGDRLEPTAYNSPRRRSGCSILIGLRDRIGLGRQGWPSRQAITLRPGRIPQLSTGGRSGAGPARDGMLPLRSALCALRHGVKNAMPADERILDFCVETLGRVAVVRRRNWPGAAAGQ